MILSNQRFSRDVVIVIYLVLIKLTLRIQVKTFFWSSDPACDYMITRPKTTHMKCVIKPERNFQMMWQSGRNRGNFRFSTLDSTLRPMQAYIVHVKFHLFSE